ncbi:MAG: hypothetical protein E7047_03395 [Lentisphaerae bacterium]|nr:hypothetical protein [Lentisphaerota bacterium]
MKKFTLLCAAAVLASSVCTVDAYDKSEYKVRPWEIIQGLQPHSELVWDMAKGDLAEWKATGKGKLSVSTETKLWGENVAKLALPSSGAVTITPPQPLVVKDADGLDLWVFGPLGTIPQIDFMIVDAKGVTYRVPTSGCGSRWNKSRWWGAAAGLIPEKAVMPIKIKSIRFSKLSARHPNDYLCFDRIGAYKENKVEIFDSSKSKNPFPVTEDGIMPLSMKKDAVNHVVKQGNSYVFSYEGKDAKVVYTYTPKSGTLSDLSVTINGKSFQPAVNGGIVANVKSAKFTPAAANLKAKLLKQSFENNRLQTLWQWTLNGETFKFEQNFWIKGKSLAVETRALSADGIAFDCGKTLNTENPRLFQLTYLNNRWNYPRIMVTDDYFVSVFLDWYYSDASSLMEGSSRFGVDGARVYSKKSAKIMGGSYYLPLTNGKRNPVYEKMYITVSPELHDVMPHINNPPSHLLDVTKNLVCCTRAYALQGNPKHADGEIALWQKMHDYGATDIFVRYHSGILRTPVESNNITFQLDGGYQNGGDATVRKMTDGVRKSVKVVGLYGENRVVHPLDEAPYFTYGGLMKQSNNTYLPGWDGIFRPKSGIQLALQKRYIPALLERYPALNGMYLDELSNAPPWADTDYDANIPGAGKFATTFRDYGLVALQQSRLYNGPIWSEGCAAYFWAGLLDIDYACSNDTRLGLPLIVDFKLHKINPLSSLTGADWPMLHMPKDDKSIDRLVAQEIVCGNIGHLGKSGDGAMPWQGLASRLKNFAPVLQSYFMIRQVQEYYIGHAPELIQYDINGKMMTASEMLKGNFKPSNRIYTKWPTGLQTWVNRGESGNWVVNVDGEEYVIPPDGHVAVVPDELLQYSALKDGRRVDYSNGKYYIYLDGRGEITEFPEMTAAYAYVIRQMDGKTRITPAPFVKAETIKGLSYTKATPLAQNGQVQGATVSLDVTDAGMGDLAVDGKAFHYTME